MSTYGVSIHTIPSPPKPLPESARVKTTKKIGPYSRHSADLQDERWQHGNTVGEDCEDGCCLHQSERPALRNPLGAGTPMQAVNRPVDPESDNYALKKAGSKLAEPKSANQSETETPRGEPCSEK